VFVFYNRLRTVIICNIFLDWGANNNKELSELLPYKIENTRWHYRMTHRTNSFRVQASQHAAVFTQCKRAPWYTC